MIEGEVMAKFVDGLATSGPLALTLGLGVWVLWRKAEAKDAAVAGLTREVLTALQGNTTALQDLRDAIEQGERRPVRRAVGAD